MGLEERTIGMVWFARRKVKVFLEEAPYLVKLEEDQGPIEHSWLSQVLGLKDRLSQLDLNLLPEMEKIRPKADSDFVLNKADD
ncbi:hypothetical protein Q3G72_010639 [Acer saccharum]|nr:hypothetical protein Q3G72_010639 [Acer saccharum]